MFIAKISSKFNLSLEPFKQFSLFLCLSTEFNNPIKTTQIMNLSKIWSLYYPVILAFLSFVYSVSLWFSGNKLEGIFVGIWVPSILGFSVAIRQIRRDTNQQKP